MAIQTITNKLRKKLTKYTDSDYIGWHINALNIYTSDKIQKAVIIVLLVFCIFLTNHLLSQKDEVKVIVVRTNKLGQATSVERAYGNEKPEITEQENKKGFI